MTGAPNRDDLVVEDLVVGTGPALQAGQTAVLQLVAFRGDTGEQTFSTWASGQPVGVHLRRRRGDAAGLVDGHRRA